ncbi:MAG: DivIVA domain-containing protein, partial [Propionicimonas sp.]
MTPPAEDTTGLELFDETASAAGNFPLSLRGYDRGAVDAYVRDVEAQLAGVKRQLRHVQRRLTEANLRVDDTDYSKLGAHTRGLLKAAESQAAELLKSAEEQASKMVAEAEAVTQQASAEARLALDASQASTIADITRIREQLSAQTAAELQAAREEASALRAAAERDREQILAEATLTAQGLVGAGRREAEQI